MQIAQLGEHLAGSEKVTSSSLVLYTTGVLTAVNVSRHKTNTIELSAHVRSRLLATALLSGLAKKRASIKKGVVFMSKMIEITLEEYEELLEDARFLDALRASGVDNWEGYEYAKDIMAEG